MTKEEQELSDAVNAVAQWANEWEATAETDGESGYAVGDEDMTELRAALKRWREASQAFLRAQVAITFEFPTPEEANGFASIVRLSAGAAKRSHRVVDVLRCGDHENVRRIAKQFSGTEVRT